jgi:anti-anti-sigma factor
LTAAAGAELGDLTSTAHPLWAAAGVSVRSEADGHVVVEVRGDLASGSAAYLDVVLEQEFSAAPTAVVVDLSGTVFVGVRGIAVLVRAAARAVESMTTLCVVSPFCCDLARHLRFVGVEELFDLHGSLPDCRAASARREPVLSPRTPSRSPADRKVVDRGRAAGKGPARGDSDLRISAQPVGGFVLVWLSGPLSLRTVGAVAAALGKLLLDGGRVVADVSDLRLVWTPALQVFPSTLASLGGWPTARLVLLGADREVGAAVRALRIDQAVPLARDMGEARELIERRPAIVSRYHELPAESGSPRRARALLCAACRDWQVEALVPGAAIVVSELVTNTVQHAGTGCLVSLRLDHAGLHVAVRDRQVADGTLLDRLRGGVETGMGLGIVAAFSRAHGVTRTPTARPSGLSSPCTRQPDRHRPAVDSGIRCLRAGRGSVRRRWPPRPCPNSGFHGHHQNEEAAPNAARPARGNGNFVSTKLQSY